MFDVARIVALAWAFALAIRARRWPEASIVVVVAHLVGAEIASGFTIRDEGPMEPVMSMLLVLIGPSALPRGRLPALLPLSALVVRQPAIVDALGAVLLWVPSRVLTARALALPARDEAAIRRIDRIAVAFVWCAVLQGVAAALRVIPHLLGGDAGNGRL